MELCRALHRYDLCDTSRALYLEPTSWPAPSWLVSSVGRALHRYRRGHGFKSRTGLIFFQALFSLLLKLCTLLRGSLSFTFMYRLRWTGQKKYEKWCKEMVAPVLGFFLGKKLEGFSLSWRTPNCILLYRYWWNTRIFYFTKKSYLHRAQWRYYFYLSRVRIVVSPYITINISIIVFISPV